MNTISLLNTLSNSKVISSTSSTTVSVSIRKSFSYGLYDYYVFSSGRSFVCNSNGTIDYLIIGGGGAGGGNHAGGGGAGGVAYGSTELVSETTYSVTVGAGGIGGGGVYTTNVYTAANNNGGNSSIVGGVVNIIAYGGGYGGGGNNGFAYNNGAAGNTGFTILGSGGGGMAYNLPINTSIDLRAGVGGNGVNNALYGSAGKNGGAGFYTSTAGNGGGGGGAGTVGGNASSALGGNGGNGLNSTVLTWLPQVNASGYMNILTSTWSTATTNGTYIAAGGGGGSWSQNGWQPGTGGLGGGGAGGANGTGSGLAGLNGTNYTGSGGGGGASTGNVGGSGGSGLVIIRILSLINSSTPNLLYDPISYYGFDIQNGTTLYETISASNKSNALVGSATVSYTNAYNGAGSLYIPSVSAGNYASFPAVNIGSATGLSICFWFNFDNVTFGPYQNLFQINSSLLETNNIINIQYNNSSTALSFGMFNGSSNPSIFVVNTNIVNIINTKNIWNFFAATINSTNVNTASGTISGTITLYAYSPTTGLVTQTSDLKNQFSFYQNCNLTSNLGYASLNTGGGAGSCQGYFDSFRLFNKALTSSQMQEIINSDIASSISVKYFSPNQITGLNNWYDGLDPNGTGSAPTNGTSISSWVDKTTNANHMVAQTAGTYATNNLNGFGTITFSNSWYRTTTANAPYPMDAYVVVKLNSTSTAVDVLGAGSRTVDNFNSLTFSEYAANRWHNGSSNFSRTPNAVAASNETSTSFLLMSWSIANNNFYIYRNGVRIISTNSYTWGPSGNNEFIIGARANVSTANNMKGSIAEVLFFNTPLSNADRQKVEGYLASKWGLITSLPIYHPYYIPVPTGPIIPSTDSVLNNISTEGKAVMLNTGTNLQAGALGLVKLNSLYTGPTIQIKAGLAGTPTDFYARSTNTYGTLQTIGGMSLITFLGGQIAYVTKWYDQTGNDNHATNIGNVSYNTTTNVVSFAGNYFSVPNNAFPTGNSAYSYLFTPNNQTSNTNTIFQGGSLDYGFLCLSTLGYNFPEISTDTYNNSWYANVIRYGVGYSTLPNRVKIADCYNGTNGATGRTFYINNVSKSYTGGSNAARNQTPFNNYIGHSDYTGETLINYSGSLQYFFWAPALLSLSDITILHADLSIISFLPNQITGLRLWLDAQSASTFSTNNNLVTWADKSDTGNNMAQTAYKTGYPIVLQTTSKFNNKPAVYIPQQGLPPLRNTNIQTASFPVTFFMVFGADANNGYNQGGIDLNTSWLAADYINDSGIYTGGDTPHNQVQISMNNYNFYVGATNGAPGQYTFNVSSSNLSLVMVQMNGSNNTATTMIVNYNGTNLNTNNSYNRTYTTQHQGIIIYAGQQPLYMCECVYYKSLLTSSEIKKVEGYLAKKWEMQNNLPAVHPYSSALVLHWPFDTTMNESVNNYTATSYGDIPAISNTIYKVGTGSLNCTGSLAYVMYTNTNGILPISNTYTFSFWYYPTSNAKYYSHLFSFANSGGNDNIDLYFNLNQLTLFLILRNGSSSVYNDQASVGNLTTNVALTINTWNHIALSITSHSSNVYITLWKNNVKTTYSRPSTNGIPQVARQFAYINGSVLSPIPPASNGDSSTTTYVDDFRVYNTLLTDADVTALYNNTI